MSTQFPLDLALVPDNSAGAFVRGASNVEAVTALADTAGWANNILAIIGPKGSGKTHLGHIWAAEHQAISLDAKNIVESDGFVPRKDYRGRALWIDNASSADEYTLFTLINLTITGELQALLLTDQNMPAKWDVQLPDLHSRLKNVQIARLQEPDEGLLSAIITKLFMDRGLKVSDTLIDYLLVHADRSVDSLRALIRALDKKAAAEKVNVTRAFAAKYLPEFMQGQLF